MNDQQTKLKETIYLTARYYNQDLSPEILRMYVDDLAGFDVLKTMEAYKTYRLNPKNRFAPTPVQIIAIMNPQSSSEDQSNEVASRIRQAISKFGWCNANDAKKFIGGIGWEIVERSGGWQNLCENHGLTLNATTFYAQSRDIAKSMIEEQKISGKFVSLDHYEKNQIQYSDSSSNNLMHAIGMNVNSLEVSE